MTQESDPVQFVDREPDERLLSEDVGKLPEAVGRPEEIVPSRARGRIVGTGATLTAASLILGSLLVILGLIDAVSSGIDGLSIAILVVGAVLVITHWGWVCTSPSSRPTRIEGLEHRRGREPPAAVALGDPAVPAVRDHDQRRGRRLDHHRARRVSPRRERGAAVHVRAGDRTGRESTPPTSFAATVTERAELLRRDAAQETERERERYEIAADAYESALLDDADEQQRRLAQRAASEALSHQINSNLRDPPLLE